MGRSGIGPVSDDNDCPGASNWRGEGEAGLGEAPFCALGI